MRKPFKHTELSDKHTCRICGKGIKLNLVKIKPTVPRLCYKHFMNKERKENKSTKIGCDLGL
jgi:hypothetical protein